MRVLIFIILLLPSQVLAGPPSNFDKGKEAALGLWWNIGPSSFYCQCPYRKATEEEKEIRKGNLWAIGSVCGYEAKTPATSKCPSEKLLNPYKVM